MLGSFCFIILTGINNGFSGGTRGETEIKMLIPVHQIGYVKKLGKDKYSTVKIVNPPNDHHFEIKETAEEVAQIIKKECKQ